MTSNNVCEHILRELVKIMHMPGSHRDSFAVCDLVDQDNLFAVQEQLAMVALAVADNCGKADWLGQQFPALYTKVEGDEL